MKAVIFDMDGVIVDSERQWQLAEGEFFRSLMPHWREEDHHKIVGLAVEDLYHWLVREYSLTASKENFLRQCDELAHVVYNERVSLTPGFMELLDDLRRRRIPVGLASSSPKMWVNMTLRRFGLSEALAAQAVADDVPSGRTKPQPDLYELVLRRLGLKAEGCLAIEDSAFGVRAAKSAGLVCAALRNGSNDSQDLSAADFELRGLAGMNYQSLLTLYVRCCRQHHLGG